MVNPEHSRQIEHNEQGEQGANLELQLSNYLNYLYSGIELTPNAAALLPGTENVKVELERKALGQATEIIERNNVVATHLNSPEFQRIQDREKDQKGNCAIGVSDCIDGRLPAPHLYAYIAGISETMAGVLPTYKSNLDGRTRLESKTLEQTIAARPNQEQYYELLQLFIAHEHCGAMKKWEGERKGTEGEFKSDDLIQVNLDLYKDGMEAITRKYNNASVAAGREALEKVCIRAVYNPETMGLTVGYGEQEPISSTQIAEKVCEEFGDVHARYAENFTDLDSYIEKEGDIVSTIERLFRNDYFNSEVSRALTDLNETKGLTDSQKQAFRFLLAKFTASQILTGVHTKEESHVKHMFVEHAEKYMAITVDDGLNVVVGQYDPSEQAFGAVVSNKEQAIDHIKTELSLMDSNGLVKPPYILFISNAVDEESGGRTNGKIKQARANVARNFRFIVENEEIAKAVKDGRIVPIPVIITNRSRTIIEVPNLAL